MNVRYVGPAFDYSGYGEAVRHDIGALVSAGCQVTLTSPRYTRETSDFDKLGNLVSSIEDRQLDYLINIIHTTPDQIKKYYEPNKYNIGRIFWETDKLPPDFAEGCGLVDEIWTGSNYNAQAIKNAGVNKPIFIIPEAIDANLNTEFLRPYKSVVGNNYSFYSIFEWTERKNPDCLLRAYWQEFNKNDNVALVLKTYLDDFSVSKRRDISQAISAIKSALKLDYYAPVYVYRDLMLRQQVYRFHKSFDCYVSPHRGEGWGIPQMEAMLLAKPVISTNCGGIHEYLSDGVDSLLLQPSSMVKVENTRNSQWYCPDQLWAQVDVKDLQEKMRWAYGNQADANLIGGRGRELVTRLFSLEAVGVKMLARLRDI